MLKRAPFDVDRHNHFIMNEVLRLLNVLSSSDFWSEILMGTYNYKSMLVLYMFCFLVFGIRLIARLRSSVDSQIGQMKTSVVQLVTWILCCLTSRDPIIIKDAYMIVMLMWTSRIAIDICIPCTYLVFLSSSSSIHCCIRSQKLYAYVFLIIKKEWRQCQWTNKWKTTKKYKRVVVLLG